MRNKNPTATRHVSRRTALCRTADAFLGGTGIIGLTNIAQAKARQDQTSKPQSTSAENSPSAKAPVHKVAGVITVFCPNAHADVLLSKIVTGWRHDGGPGPSLQLASLYVDQFANRDMARELCQRHGIPIFDTIEGAVTVGTKGIPVDGVISIGEHGDYPINAKGQQLYPRWRFFREICDAFEKYGRIVPVFSDKHLGPVWSDAVAMYRRAQQLNVPFMAGSSMPVGYRIADIDVPMGSELEAVVGIGYSGVDVYGFHALELMQYYAERRRGAEHGVRWVQCLQGPAVWQAVDNGFINAAALNSAWEICPKSGSGNIRDDDQPTLLMFEYTDGLPGALLMLSKARGTSVGLKLKNSDQPLATGFDERTEPRYPHFAFLLKAVETMIETGRPTYPIERTLLTSGILDRSLTSLAENGSRRKTPELSITYSPADYPHPLNTDQGVPEYINRTQKASNTAVP